MLNFLLLRSAFCRGVPRLYTPNHVTKKRQALGTRMKRDPERPSRPSLPNQSSELSRLLAARAPRGLQLPCQQSRFDLS